MSTPKTLSWFLYFKSPLAPSPGIRTILLPFFLILGSIMNFFPGAYALTRYGYSGLDTNCNVQVWEDGNSGGPCQNMGEAPNGNWIICEVKLALHNKMEIMARDTPAIVYHLTGKQNI